MVRLDDGSSVGTYNTGGATDPAGIPGAAIDIETIRTQAKAITGVATAIRDETLSVTTAWSPITNSYVAPESQQLIDVMVPVKTRGETIAADLDVIAGALSAFADEVEPVKALLDKYRAQAWQFLLGPVQYGVLKNPGFSAASSHWWDLNWGTTAPAGTPEEEKDDWDRNDISLGFDAELKRRIALSASDLTAAERTAANKIRALWGGVPLASGDACTDTPERFRYGFDVIPEGADMPWGNPVAYREEGWEAVFGGIGRAVTKFVTEGVQAVAGLLGFYNVTTGEWGWDVGNITTTVQTMLDAVSALVLAGVALVERGVESYVGIKFDGPIDDILDDAVDTVVEMFPSAEEWAKDPWAAGTELFLTVASFAFPVGGGVLAGIKLTSKVATVLVSTVEKIGKFFDAIDPVNGLMKLTGFVGSKVATSLSNLFGYFDADHRALLHVRADVDAMRRELIDSGVDPNSIRVFSEEGRLVLMSEAGVWTIREAGEFDPALFQSRRLGDIEIPGVTDVVPTIRAAEDVAPELRDIAEGHGEVPALRDAEARELVGVGARNADASVGGHAGDGRLGGDGGRFGSDGDGFGSDGVGGHSTDGAGDGGRSGDDPGGAAGHGDDGPGGEGKSKPAPPSFHTEASDPSWDPKSSPNPRVHELFDKNGNLLSYEMWLLVADDYPSNPNHSKGLYGELVTQARMESLGFDRIDVGATGAKSVVANGIDGVFVREVDGEKQYVITESKYGQAGLKWTKSGRQGTVSWILDRIDGAVPGNNEIFDMLSNTLERFHSDPTGWRQGPDDLVGTLVRISPEGAADMTTLAPHVEKRPTRLRQGKE